MKTTYEYDHYYLQDEIEQHVKGLAEKFPGLVKWEYLLETADGHHIIAVTLTNKETGDASEKPAFHIDGNTHAGEVTGMMAAMHAMDYFCTSYGSDAKVKWILDHIAVYIVPCVSPDGSQTYLTTPYTLRSVNRDYYELKDGLSEEDMDGDGCIRMMRIPDAYGAWKKSADDPDLMVKRLPDDVKGEFYSIYSEGEMVGSTDGGIKLRKEKWGLDFNRNYPYGWFPESRQPGAGPYPLSNPETKALAQWIIDHKNIGSVATNHTSGGMLLTVPGTYSEKNAPAADMELLHKLGNMGTQATGYKHVNIFDFFISDKDKYDSGAFDDYCYETQGIYAMTLELWDLDARCGIKHFWEETPGPDKDSENFAKRMKWVKENAPESFLSWTPFRHPQFGNVEIGGFNSKFSVQNPPCSLLRQECEKTTAFMIRWAMALPRLVIDKVEVTELAEGVYKAEAVVSNAGFLPTNLSEKAVSLGVAKPVSVSIDSADGLISGKQTQEIGHLSGYGMASTGTWYYGNIMTDPEEPVSKKVCWIYKGKRNSITVTAQTPKGGKVSKTVEI